MDASTLQLIILPAGIIAVLFAIYLARDVLARDTGTQAMQDVAGTIFEGAVAFIRRQYTTIGILAVVGAVVIGARDHLFETKDVAETDIFGLDLGWRDRARLPRRRRLLDGLGDHRHVHQRQGQRPDRGGRPAQPRRGGPGRDARRGRLRLPRRRPVAARRVRHLHPVRRARRRRDRSPRRPFLIVGFGFGASFVALFAQLGGGIYTKAADVGSDLVGKVEKGIPEDDPRNAGVVADLVGDNVGDCAGRGADLFESTAAENIGAMILGVGVFAIADAAGWPNPEAWIFFPLVVRAFGLLATIVAIFFVRGKETEDPMNMLNRGYWVTTLLSVVGAGCITTNVMMQTNGSVGAVGLPDLGLLLRRRRRRPRHQRRLRLHHPVLHGRLVPARSARSPRRRKTGPATNIISRHRRRLRDDLRHRDHDRHRAVRQPLARRRRPGIVNADGRNVGGIFGTAVATMGMLMTTAYILAMDTFGPITDNAGGIAEFSRAEAGAREITDRLDAVGNTTKALTKGYAIASASLAAFLLFSAYIDKVNLIQGRRIEAGVPGAALLESVNLANVNVFIAALIGAMLVYFFSSLAIRAVGKTAQSIIVEVRRQFREMPGIMDYTQRPDYARVVDITTKAALREMIAPGRRRGRHADRRRRCCSAPRRSPAC